MTSTQTTDFDAIVVGAGFGGIYQLHTLRDKLGLRVRGGGGARTGRQGGQGQRTGAGG